MIRVFISLFLAQIAFTAVGQMSFEQVDLEGIPYRKVRSYIQVQTQNTDIQHFRDLKPTCDEIKDPSKFETYVKKYKVKGSLAEVWDGYIQASPTMAWKTRKSAVGLIYDRKKDELKYANDTCNGSRIGQIVYLHMNLVKGLYHLATAIEITDIRKDSSLIELTYVDNGVNEGKQWITMEELENGIIEVHHKSMIRSDSKFRDKYLYPYFHNRLINAFHKNIRKQIAKSRSHRPDDLVAES